MIRNSTHYIYLFLFVIASTTVISCGDDDEVISGCTDVKAENYNPNATEDNGLCVYPNEKFFGNYSGSFTCPAPFDIINQDVVEFRLTPPADAGEVNKVTVSATITGIPLSLDGDVDGDKILFVDKTIENISVQGVTTDVTFSGEGTLNGNVLTANLQVSAVIVIPLSSACTFTGMKQ